MTTQLLYVSVSNLSGPLEVTEEEITRILSTAYVNNSQRGLTGVLLHCEQYFAQLLEGGADEVHSTFDVIAKDSRHHDVIRVFSRTVPQPAVPRTAMGCAGIAGKCPDMLIPTLLRKGATADGDLAAEKLVDYMIQRVRAGDIELPPVADS